MALILPPPPHDKIEENHNWREWFFSVWVYASTVASNAFTGLNFIGSNITSIVTRNHNDLTIIQGGSTTERYHLTSAQATIVTELLPLGSSGQVLSSTGTALSWIPPAGGLLSFNGGLTALTTIAATVTPTTGGVTLTSQTAVTDAVWRITAHGNFTAVSSATARDAIVSGFWGATALPTITVATLVSVAQTSSWQLEFIITTSTTAAAWTTGFLNNKIADPAIVAGVSSQRTLDLPTPASTVITAGAQTVDLRFSMSAVVAGDSWIVHNVLIERLK